MSLTDLIVVVVVFTTALFFSEAEMERKQTKESKQVMCSFCGKGSTGENRVKKGLMEGNDGSYICDECVVLGSDIFGTDSLAQMWEQQERFMRLLQEKRGFPQFPTDITSKKGQQFLKDIRNHLMEELFEAGQHLKNAKSHRATELPEVDREAYKEELVDALHLYFELVIASGVTFEELREAYLAKGEVNFDRIRNGY